MPAIFGDAHFRSSGVEGDANNASLSPTGVVAGRRRITDVMVREFQDFGLALVIAVLPLVQALLPSDAAEVSPLTWTVAVLLPAGVLTMLCWRVRNQVR